MDQPENGRSSFRCAYSLMLVRTGILVGGFQSRFPSYQNFQADHDQALTWDEPSSDDFELGTAGVAGMNRALA